MAGKRDQPRVFFPWETRRGVRSLLGPARGRQLMLAAACLGGFVLLRGRERRAADVRATRAEITTATLALAAWQADHDHACPTSLGELVAAGYVHAVPRDAWGRPLRVTCPGRRDRAGFDVSSDGPDGESGGVDRIE